VFANPPADENAVYLKYLINTAIDFYRRGNAENTGSALAEIPDKYRDRFLPPRERRKYGIRVGCTVTIIIPTNTSITK
jgi:hypothetical protein